MSDARLIIYPDNKIEEIKKQHRNRLLIYETSYNRLHSHKDIPLRTFPQ